MKDEADGIEKSNHRYESYLMLQETAKDGRREARSEEDLAQDDLESKYAVLPGADCFDVSLEEQNFNRSGGI